MSMQCCTRAGSDLSEHVAGATMFKALGDQHRLAILQQLSRADEEVCVCDFTAALPLNQPTVSHHLKILRDAGLVTCERRGTWVYYRLASGVAERIAHFTHSIFPERVLA